MSELPVPDVDASSLQVRLDGSVPVLSIPAELSFDELRVWVRQALPGRLSEINGRASRLDLGARSIQLFDLRRLIHLLRDEFSVDITGLYVEPDAIQSYAERELKLKLFPVGAPELPEPAPAPVVVEEVEEAPVAQEEQAAAEERDEALVLPTDIRPEDLDDAAPAVLLPDVSLEEVGELAFEAPRRQAPEQGARTHTLHRTLRSGQSVRYDGDVIVFGDVNPGANVIATGNVVVLGALKGMAHAGALGDEKKSILAFDFRPTQVRIGSKIAIPPTSHKSAPELVVVRDDEIVIEPYTGRYR